MTHQEFLEMKAAAYIDQGEPLPIDLVMQMAAAGMDVEAIEKQLINQKEQLDG